MFFIFLFHIHIFFAFFMVIFPKQFFFYYNHIYFQKMYKCYNYIYSTTIFSLLNRSIILETSHFINLVSVDVHYDKAL